MGQTEERQQGLIMPVFFVFHPVTDTTNSMHGSPPGRKSSQAAPPQICGLA